MQSSPHQPDIVTDPVGHISISGVHGRHELEQRAAHRRPHDDHDHTGRVVAGALIGAAIMYLLDPERGARRRSLIRDKLVHAGHVTGDRLGKLGRDVRNRAAGTLAETRARLTSHDVDDVVLTERVRAEIGHVASRAGSITVTAADGCVILSGPVLADEVDRVIAAARKVRGVRDVRSALDVHETPGRIPGLQGTA